MNQPYICNLYSPPNGHKMQPWNFIMWQKFSYPNSIDFQLRINIFSTWISSISSHKFHNSP